MWLGATRTGVGSMYFFVFDGAPVKTGQIIVDGQKMQTIGNTAWFSNLDHGRRHQPLSLMKMEENLRFNKAVMEVGYQKYDNYDAVEVPRVDAIPSDYGGVMGVPITFLGKYNPDQFELVKFRHGNDGKDLCLPNGKTPYFRILIRHKSTTV